MLLRRENEISIQFPSKDIGELSPDQEDKLFWISPVGDSVRVHCNRYVNVAQARCD